MTRLALSCVAVACLATAVSGCRRVDHRPTSPDTVGRWTVTKYLVRVLEVDLDTASEAARTYAALEGFDLRSDELERRAHERVRIIHAFTPGGPVAYHTGRGRSLIFRLRQRDKAPGVVAVELKSGPAYSQTETTERMDGYQRVLYEVLHDRRARSGEQPADDGS